MVSLQSKTFIGGNEVNIIVLLHKHNNFAILIKDSISFDVYKMTKIATGIEWTQQYFFVKMNFKVFFFFFVYVRLIDNILITL